jgi:hypothetical protein
MRSLANWNALAHLLDNSIRFGEQIKGHVKVALSGFEQNGAHGRECR